jgi:hypothetical protein
VNAIIDTNIFYDWSEIKNSSHSPFLIEKYLNENFEKVYISIFTLYEVLNQDTFIQVRNFIIEKDIKIALFDQRDSDQSIFEIALELIIKNDERFLNYKERILLDTKNFLHNSILNFFQVLLVIILSSAAMALEKNNADQELLNRNYALLTSNAKLFLKEEVDELMFKYFNSAPANRNKFFNQSISNFIQGLVSFSNQFYEATLNSFDLINFLTESKPSEFNNSIHCIENCFDEVKDILIKKYPETNSLISYKYRIQLIRNLFLKGNKKGKIEINDFIDSALLAFLNKYTFLTYDTKILDYLKENEEPHYRHCKKFIDSTI